MTARTITLAEGGPRLAVDVYEPEAETSAGTGAAPRAAVLCVHGFASSRRSTKIRHLAADLVPRGVAVLAPDLEGHGASGGSFEGLTISRSISDVRRVAGLAPYRDAGRRVIVGSSYGGLVCAWAAAEDERLCDALVLVAPAFGFLDRYLETLDDAERTRWRAGGVHVVSLPDRDVPLASGVLRENDLRRVRDLAARLRVPTLIVHGDADESVPVTASRAFSAAAGDGVRLVEIEHGTHDLVTHLDVLAQLVQGVIEGGDGPSRASTS